MIKHCHSYYRPPTELREGNVFSRVCLSSCLFTVLGPMCPLPMMHWTSPIAGHGTSLYREPLTLWTWDITVLDLPARHGTLLYKDLSPISADIWRMGSGSDRYASYSNAFLLPSAVIFLRRGKHQCPSLWIS